MNVDSGTVTARILRSEREGATLQEDRLAVEEPLEMAVTNGELTLPLGVTFRTPGDDKALVAGFLCSEGILSSPRELRSIDLSVATGATMPAGRALARVSESVRLGRDRPERVFPISAACGACGKSSLQALRIEREERFPVAPQLQASPELLKRLPEAMRNGQSAFAETGGIHAAARFSYEGELLDIAEDIGRHNALDKLVGRAALADQLDWSEQILVFSGRVGYDLMQKTIRAGCPMAVSVGAASSLAVELAGIFHITLVGFVRAQRFNVYCAPERIQLS